MNVQKSKADLRDEQIAKEYNILVFNNNLVKEATFNTLNKIEKKHLGSFTFGQKKETFYRHELFFESLKTSRLVRHPFILSLYGVIMNQDTNNYDYAIEIIKGTDLSQLIKYETNTEIEQIMIALDLCKVLTYLHMNDFVHRQLFPNNALIDVKKDFRLLIDFSVIHRIEDANANPMKKRRNAIKPNIIEITKEFDIWAFGNFLNELFSGGDKLWIQIGNESNKGLSLLYEQYPYSVSNKIKNERVRRIIETCALVKHGSDYNISNLTVELYKEFFKLVKNTQNFSSLFAHYSSKEKYYLLNKIRSYLVLHKFYLNMNQKKIKDFNFLYVHYFKQDKAPRRKSRIGTIGTMMMTIDEIIAKPITKDTVKKFISKLKISMLQSEKLRVKNQILGEGGFATIKKAEFNGLDIALKKLNVFDIEKFTREIIIIKKYNHPNIPLLYGLIQKSKDQAITFEIAFEFIKGFTLDLYLLNVKQITEIEKLLIILDLAQVIEYLHAFNLIHRDLKPQNIMINEKKEIKLFDFGISKITHHSETKTREGTGTCFYMAPENYPENKFNSNIDDSDSSIDEETLEDLDIKISNKIDIWAFGLIINEIFSSEKPWQGRISKGIPNHIKAIQIQQLLIQRATFEPSQNMGNDIRKVVFACTKINPAERPTMKQIKMFFLKKFYSYVKKTNLNNYFEYEKVKDRVYLLHKVRGYILLYGAIVHQIILSIISF